MWAKLTIFSAHARADVDERSEMQFCPGFSVKFLRKNPDEIVLQVGTNSLRPSTSARECAEEIVHLAHMISDEYSAKLSISSLVSGVDDKALGVKVSGVIKILRKFCNQNDWGYIDHSNISADYDLNRSGLHLNAKGTARLASNFIKFLKLRGD